MRFAAQKTIHFQDMLPADGSIYMPDLKDKGGSMMKALRDWEKRRGLSFSFKGKFLGLKPKKTEENKEKTKPEQTNNRPIVVPRDRMQPGRPREFTKEEKRLRKNESNKRARDKNREHHAAKSREWRAKLTEEQRQEVLRKAREWKRARKAEASAAVDAANGSGAVKLSLANPDLQGKKR